MIIRRTLYGVLRNCFLDLNEYTRKCPFGASTMVEFWKRFPHNAIAALLAASSLVEDQDDHNDQNGVHKVFWLRQETQEIRTMK